MTSTLDRLVLEVGHLVSLVGGLASSDSGPKNLLGALGWDLPPGATDLGFAAIDVTNLVGAVNDVEQALQSGMSGLALDAKFATLLGDLGPALTQLRALAADFGAEHAYLDATHIRTEFLPRLSSLMAASRLAARR
jgi:hypothetical protein